MLTVLAEIFNKRLGAYSKKWYSSNADRSLMIVPYFNLARVFNTRRTLEHLVPYLPSRLWRLVILGMRVVEDKADFFSYISLIFSVSLLLQRFLPKVDKASLLMPER